MAGDTQEALPEASEVNTLFAPAPFDSRMLFALIPPETVSVESAVAVPIANLPTFTISRPAALLPAVSTESIPLVVYVLPPGSVTLLPPVIDKVFPLKDNVCASVLSK